VGVELAEIAAIIDATENQIDASDNERVLSTNTLNVQNNVNRGFSREPTLKRNSKLRSDALIVAALMGNSTGFSQNINNIINDKKKLKSQLSSPAQLAVSPVHHGDSASMQSVSINEHRPKSKVDSRQSYLSPNMEMATFSQSQGGFELDPNNSTNSFSTGTSKNILKNSTGSSKASKCMLIIIS
jgi:hypothetical protein